MSDVGWFVLGWARAKVTDLEKIAALGQGQNGRRDSNRKRSVG
jgi:hypothetical protein